MFPLPWVSRSSTLTLCVSPVSPLPPYFVSPGPYDPPSLCPLCPSPHPVSPGLFCPPHPMSPGPFCPSTNPVSPGPCIPCSLVSGFPQPQVPHVPAAPCFPMSFSAPHPLSLSPASSLPCVPESSCPPALSPPVPIPTSLSLQTPLLPIAAPTIPKARFCGAEEGARTGWGSH